MSGACVHCGTGKVCRPRGLCWPCYYRPGVRDRYATAVAYTRWDGGNPAGRLPARPTAASPGTEAKVLVMMRRAERQEALHHPGDCRDLFMVEAWMLLDRRPFGEGVARGD